MHDSVIRQDNHTTQAATREKRVVRDRLSVALYDDVRYPGASRRKQQLALSGSLVAENTLVPPTLAD